MSYCWTEEKGNYKVSSNDFRKGRNLIYFSVQSSLKKSLTSFAEEQELRLQKSMETLDIFTYVISPIKLVRADEVLVLRYVVNEIFKLTEVGTEEIMEDWKNIICLYQ